MNITTRNQKWLKLLSLFSEQNAMRPTRVSVFEGEPGAMSDYWLEDGLPLLGIDVDTRADQETPTVEIMLGSISGESGSHMTHSVPGARFARIVLSASGETDGLDIEDFEGKTTILRFES